MPNLLSKGKVPWLDKAQISHWILLGHYWPHKALFQEPRHFVALIIIVPHLCILFQMVLWKDQTSRSRKEAVTCSKWTWRIFDPGLRIAKEWLLIISPRRRHSETLSHTATGWGWFLHCKANHFQNSARIGRSL